MTDAELTLDALERMGGKQVTFYVGPDGNDANWGRSYVARLETISEALGRILPGDQIVVAPGRHQEVL